MEPCKTSDRIFTRNNPWVAAILALAAEIYTSDAIKLNLKFDVEMLFRHFSLQACALLRGAADTCAGLCSCKCRACQSRVSALPWTPTEAEVSSRQSWLCMLHRLQHGRAPVSFQAHLHACQACTCPDALRNWAGARREGHGHAQVPHAHDGGEPRLSPGQRGCRRAPAGAHTTACAPCRAVTASALANVPRGVTAQRDCPWLARHARCARLRRRIICNLARSSPFAELAQPQASPTSHEGSSLSATAPGWHGLPGVPESGHVLH